MTTIDIGTRIIEGPHSYTVVSLFWPEDGSGEIVDMVHDGTGFLDNCPLDELLLSIEQGFVEVAQ